MLRPGNALFNLEYLSIYLSIYQSIHPWESHGSKWSISRFAKLQEVRDPNPGPEPCVPWQNITGMMVRKGHSTNIAELFIFFV